MNVFDSVGFSLLYIVVKCGYIDIMDLLIKGGLEVDCFFNDFMYMFLMILIILE